MKCPLCGSSHIKISRIRWSDIPELCVARLPVRCWECVWRFRVWLPQLLISKMMEETRSQMNAERKTSKA
jgi:hypothetical protein